MKTNRHSDAPSEIANKPTKSKVVERDVVPAVADTKSKQAVVFIRKADVMQFQFVPVHLPKEIGNLSLDITGQRKSDAKPSHHYYLY